jgi:hypothetical protein
MTALKMRAVQEKKRFSKIAEEALIQYLELPKEKIKPTDSQVKRLKKVNK